MKNYRYFLVFINLFFVSNFWGQCVNDVNTNYNCVPTNDALPSNPNADQYLNQFDWQPRHPNLELAKYQTNGLNQGLLLPNGEINNIYSNQVSLGGFYDYLFLNPEMTPENGWELIGFNLGYYPNMQPHSSEFNDFPYIFLYNKLTGVIRVFGLLGPGYGAFGTSIDAVVVKLVLKDVPPNFGSTTPNSYSGILRLANGQDQALDKPTSVIQVASLAKHPNANGRWFSADFHMAYDPCICHFEKRLKFEFDFIEQQDIQAQINAISVEEDLINGDFINSDLDFMNAFSYHWLPSAGPGQPQNSYAPTSSYAVYKSIETLVDKYLEQLEAYETAMGQYAANNQRLQRNKWILKAIKWSVVAGGTILIGPAAIVIGQGLLQYAPDVLKGLGQGLGPYEIDGQIINLEYLNKLGSELSGFIGDKFMNNDAMNLPVPPTPPMATFTQMNMSGAITKSTTIDGPNMYQPGSYKGQWFNPNAPMNIGSMHEYPVYNELLGHFALLKTPTVNLNQVSLDHFFHPPNEFNSQLSPWWHFNFTNIPYSSLYPGEASYGLKFLQQMQLDLSTFEYVINPALNISDSKIEVSIGCRALRNPDVYPVPIHGTPFTYTSPEYTANVESLFHDFMDTNPTNLAITQHTEGLTNVFSIESPFVPLEDMTSVVVSLCTKHVRSAFMDTHDEYIDNSTFFLNNTNLWGIGVTVNDLEFWDYFKIIPDSMYIKVRLTLTHDLPQFEGDPSCNAQLTTSKDMIYLFSYPVTVTQTSVLPSNLDINNSPYNYSNYDDNQLFGDTNFDGSFVRGCHLDGNTYLCKGKQKITINGNIDVAPNYNVIFRAPLEINVLPESLIAPEAILEIGPFFEGNHPIPQQTAQQVSTFCTTDYNANKLRSDIQSYYDSLAQANPPQEEVQQQKAPIEFIVFPNPTTGASQAGLILPELATVSISIVDIMGKVQGRPVQNQVLPMGRNVLNLESEPLAPGVYFVQVVVNGEKLTQRLVKQ